MSLSSWFSRSAGNSDGKLINKDAGSTDNANLSFDDIASQLEFYQSEYSRAIKLCDEANERFAEYRLQIKELTKSVDTELYANENLQLALDTERKAHDSLKKQSKNDQVEINLLNQSIKHLQKRLEDEKLSRVELDEYIICLEGQLAAEARLERSRSTSLDNETKSSELGNEAPLLAQPFVVVLIDGDAYGWSSDLFIQSSVNPPSDVENNYNRFSPGAVAATRIKTEVTKYILNHPEQISTSSKIVTRVFINLSGRKRQPDNTHTKKRQLSMMSEFMLQFTQSMPLFDFFDAGIGKERVDDKIRETFHLFISNPHCHAVFLAACTDNGFARMLEPYQHHAAARSKIVLVSPGYIETEIRQLGFQEVSWPAVFAQRAKHIPAKAAAKRRHAEKMSALAERERAAHHRQLGISGLQNEFVAALVLDMLPPWDMGGAMSVRSKRFSTSVSSFDLNVSENDTLLDDEAIDVDEVD